MAADLLTTIRSELDTRLSELRPLLAEYERLLAAVEALKVTGAKAASPGRVKTASSVPSAPKASTRSAPRRGRPRGSAAGAIKRAASEPVLTGGTEPKATKPTVAKRAPKSQALKRERAPRGAARQAIMAALEHGSHTVSELVTVTAMTAPNVNINVRRLLGDGAIGKTTREGKTAYALSSAIEKS